MASVFVHCYHPASLRLHAACPQRLADYSYHSSALYRLCQPAASLGQLLCAVSCCLHAFDFLAHQLSPYLPQDRLLVR